VGGGLVVAVVVACVVRKGKKKERKRVRAVFSREGNLYFNLNERKM